MSKEDLFDSMFKRADEMFARADKMFQNFPWSEPLDNSGFFSSTTTISTTDEPANDPLEYKLVKPPMGGGSLEEIEGWLNAFGEDGWDLVCFEFGHAIFSRFAEDEDEAEESGPEDV